MKVCILNSGPEELTQRIASAVQQAVPDARVAACRSQVELSRQLMPASSDVLALVALVANDGELLNMHFLEDWPSKPKLILVLPNNSPETVALGHRLRPAFVSYIWDDFTSIGNVLAHLRHKIKTDSEVGDSIFQML